MVRVQTLRGNRYVIPHPFAIRTEVACVAIRVVKPDIHGDSLIGRFRDPDRIVTGCGCSIKSEDALRRTSERWAERRKPAQRDEDGAEKP
jgi:hypothetical protein